MRFLLVVAVLCLLGPMALGQTGTGLDEVIKTVTKVPALECPRGNLCLSEATRDAREQAFTAQMSASTLQPMADDIGYLVIPYDRAPLVVTPPVVDVDGKFALLVLLTNFPSLPASYALLEAFGPMGELLYDESAPLYKDVANMTSALAYFEVVPREGAGHLLVTVGNDRFEAGFKGFQGGGTDVCEPDPHSRLDEACAMVCEDGEEFPCLSTNIPFCEEGEDLCGLGCDDSCSILCYATGLCGPSSASAQQASSTPGCEIPLAVSPPVGAYDEEGQFDENHHLITDRDINYMAVLWARQFSYSSNCDMSSGGGGLMAVAAGWRGPTQPLVRSSYGLDVQFVYHGDKCYGPYDSGGSWATSNWGSCRDTGSHTLWVKPHAQARIRPDPTVTIPNFGFEESLGDTYFNGVDTDETSCNPWYSAAEEATGYFGLLVGLATKVPTWASLFIAAGTFIVEDFFDRNACRFENYEELPGPRVGGKLTGHGIEISKKYYGGLSMLPQREVQSTVHVRAEKCESYNFVGTFGAEWSLYASTRTTGASTGRVNDGSFSFERRMEFPCGPPPV